MATHRAILREVFDMLGIKATAQDIDTHLMALTYFTAPGRCRKYGAGCAPGWINCLR
ncbi:MAG: hypothetical protein IPN85_13340 [Flavobacteriales bacterium]|nr:hypothetical protein [Flavobacteriales bacterium]